MNGKKWIKIFVVLSFLGVGFVGGVNYYIDSLGIIKKNGYLDNAAKELAKGEIVAGLKNLDERLFRKKIINNLNYQPNWIAIGSSRTMQLRQKTFLNNEETFQNYSVSGAGLNDYIALVGTHYQRFKTLPKNIILGIDPWIFNKYSDDGRYLTLIDEFNEMLLIMSATDIKQERKNLNTKILSFEYFIENIKFIKNNINNNLKGFYIVDSINVDDALKMPDGSIYYPYKNRQPDFNEVKQEAIKYATGQVYKLSNFNTFSNKDLFEKFINYLISNDVNIYFYLPSYNPYTYNKLMERKYFIINDVEEYIKSIAHKNNIRVIGSYSPHKVQLTNENFFDAMHTLDNAYNKIFTTLKSKSQKTSEY